MNHNLAMPWNDGSSGPATPDVQFHSPAAGDFMFGADAQEIVIHARAIRRCVGLTWTLSRSLFIEPFRNGKGVQQPDGTFIVRIASAGLHPGFYDLRVRVDTGTGKPLQAICAFGYRVDEMPIVDSRPANFRAFWEKGVATLKQIPLDPQEGEHKIYSHEEISEYNLKSACLPGEFDPEGRVADKVESFKVSFGGPGGKRVYGWVAKPVGNGPFPVMLVLPGGGVNPRPRPLDQARHGFLAMDIQIHGMDVDLEKYVVPPGYYDDFVFEPVEDYYYRNVYLRAVQAVNYLLSRPDADARQFVVVGGSQGGRLGITTAALDPRVTAAVVAIPANANSPYTDWAKECNGEWARTPDGGWRRIPPPEQKRSAGMDRPGAPVLPDTAENRCYPYYDAMNFAPDVKCPVLMNMGLIDGVSHPSAVYAIYKRVGSAQKTLVPLPGMGHDWSAEFDRRAYRWLTSLRGKKD
ncbi:MAG TPA: acetylxylan esterase [Planctomycetota bacterium]